VSDPSPARLAIARWPVGDRPLGGWRFLTGRLAFTDRDGRRSPDVTGGIHHP